LSSYSFIIIIKGVINNANYVLLMSLTRIVLQVDREAGAVTNRWLTVCIVWHVTGSVRRSCRNCAMLSAIVGLYCWFGFIHSFILFF